MAKDNMPIIVVCALLLICCCLPGTWFYQLDAAFTFEGEWKAKPILNALKEYKKDHGNYPYGLSSLAPEYIKKIPHPAISPRYQFEYHQCTNKETDIQSYSLSFIPKGEALGDGWHVYVSSINEWIGTDSDFTAIMYPCLVDR